MLIPELGELRSRFIGRVSHTGEEMWKAKVEELLAFNVAAKSDTARWKDPDDDMSEEEQE